MTHGSLTHEGHAAVGKEGAGERRASARRGGKAWGRAARIALLRRANVLACVRGWHVGVAWGVTWRVCKAGQERGRERAQSSPNLGLRTSKAALPPGKYDLSGAAERETSHGSRRSVMEMTYERQRRTSVSNADAIVVNDALT